MGRELSARLQQTIRVLRSVCILALALGYAAFYSIFPSATFPVSGDASFPWIFLVLAAASVFGGMEASELQEAVVAAMLALPLGYLVAVLLAFSPAFAGLYFLEPSLVPFFMARYSILVLALSLPVNLGGAVVGQLLRDRFRGGRFPDRLQP